MGSDGERRGGDGPAGKHLAVPREVPWISGSSQLFTRKRPGSREALGHSQGNALDLGKIAGHSEAGPWVSGSSRPLPGKGPGFREALGHSHRSALELWGAPGHSQGSPRMSGSPRPFPGKCPGFPGSRTIFGGSWDAPWILGSSRASQETALDLGKLEATPRKAPCISGSSQASPGKRPGSREALGHAQGSALALGMLWQFQGSALDLT